MCGDAHLWERLTIIVSKGEEGRKKRRNMKKKGKAQGNGATSATRNHFRTKRHKSKTPRKIGKLVIGDSLTGGLIVVFRIKILIFQWVPTVPTCVCRTQRKRIHCKPIADSLLLLFDCSRERSTGGLTERQASTIRKRRKYKHRKAG